MSKNMTSILIFFPLIYLLDCDYVVFLVRTHCWEEVKLLYSFFPLPQKESGMWYSVTSIIAHISPVLPAVLGGIPQPSILSPSCQVCVGGLLEKTICLKLQPHSSIQSEEVYSW